MELYDLSICFCDLYFWLLKSNIFYPGFVYSFHGSKNVFSGTMGGWTGFICLALINRVYNSTHSPTDMTAKQKKRLKLMYMFHCLLCVYILFLLVFPGFLRPVVRGNEKDILKRQ